MAARKENWGWIVDFVFAHADGRKQRVRRKSPVQTKRGAQAFERQLREEMLNPPPEPKKEVPTLKEFSKEFLETYARTHNRESEQEAKRCILNRHLLPRFGRKPLDQITVRDIERLKADLVQTHRPKTINNILSVLRKLLRYAEELEELEKVPRFRLLKIFEQPYSFLDFEEFEQLVQSTQERDPELGLAVLLAGEAGLRRGELAGLHWQDVSFPLNKLSVVRAMWRNKQVPPKGGRSRQVPLTKRLARALKAHRHLKGKHVLVREDGSAWTVEVFRWQGKRAYRLASLPAVERPWHSLRHTFCSLLAMRGGSPRAIQELAGHQQITTTMKYMHLSPTALTEAINLLNHGSSVAVKTEAKK